MPKHKNKAVQPEPDASPSSFSRYLFPITIGVLLAAVAGIGWFLFSPVPAPRQTRTDQHTCSTASQAATDCGKQTGKHGR